MSTPIPLLALAGTLLCAGCATSLPDESPPLADMEEPLALFAEPDDEPLRQELPVGGFTGAYVGDARQSLDAMLGESKGVEIVRIVENSPADAAKLAVGDVLLEARVAGAPPRALSYPSDWRAVELLCGDGTELDVVLDRANRRTRTTLHTVPRLRPPDREPPVRLREESRVGLVIRSATEVEARGAGLPPGAGAVIVGLSKLSPWRSAGLRFGDLILAVGDRDVAHPEVVVDAIRAAGERVQVACLRDGERLVVDAPMSQRAADLREIYVPLLFDHESDRGHSDTSVLFGLFRYEETRAAWRVRLLWLIRFGGGDANELLEVDH